MGIKDIRKGSCIIIKNDENVTILGVVTCVNRSNLGVEIRALDNETTPQKHYKINMYIEDLID